MSSNQHIINLSSDSSDTSDSLTSPPPFNIPTPPRGLTKEQAKKRKHDVPAPSSSSSEDLPPYPSEIDDPEYQREMEKRWNELERANRVPNPEDLPFIFTSSDEEDDYNDTLYHPTSSVKPQSSRPRMRKVNPPLTKTRKVVLGFPCPQWRGVFNINNKSKENTVEGKGKNKVE
jgi:hypothetical protein